MELKEKYMKKTSKLLALALGPLTIASLLLPAVLGTGPVSILVLLWGIQPICSFLAGLWLGRKAGVVWSCAVGALLVSFLGVVIYYNGSPFICSVVNAGVMLAGCIVASGLWPQPGQAEPDEDELAAQEESAPGENT